MTDVADDAWGRTKLYGDGIITDAGMDGAQRMLVRGTAHVRWVVNNYKKMDNWQKLHMDMFAANAFELLVRGYKPIQIARVLGIPQGFVEAVGEEAILMLKRVTDDEYQLYPGAFRKDEVGKKISCYEWERRIYDWCRDKAERVMQNTPASSDDSTVGFNLLMRAIENTGRGKNGFFVYAPKKDLWMAYKSKAYNRVMWSKDMEEARAFKHAGTAQKTIDWLNELGYDGCVITNAAGEILGKGTII